MNLSPRYQRLRRVTLSLFAALIVFSVSATAAHANLRTVADVVVKVKGFETLKTAVLAADDIFDAGLVDALSGRGQFTAFFPTNEAFQKLADALKCDLDTLVTDLISTGALPEVLKDHVAKGRKSIRRLLGDGQVTALSGRNLEVGVGERGAYVEGDFNVQGRPLITVEGIGTFNGIVYPIDEVIVNVDPTGICGFSAS